MSAAMGVAETPGELLNALDVIEWGTRSMRLLITLVGAIAMASITGCGDVTPWKAVTAAGHTYLVNRFSGTTYELVGQQLLELPKRSIEDRRTASTYKDRKFGKIPGTEFVLRIETRYLDNRMLYRVTVDPAPAASTDASSKGKKRAGLTRDSLSDEITRITINLMDEYGFKIREISTTTALYPPTVDDSGKGILRFTYADSVEIDEPTYSAVKNLSFGWNTRN